MIQIAPNGIIVIVSTFGDAESATVQSSKLVNTLGAVLTRKLRGFLKDTLFYGLFFTSRES